MQALSTAAVAEFVRTSKLLQAAFDSVIELARDHAHACHAPRILRHSHAFIECLRGLEFFVYGAWSDSPQFDIEIANNTPCRDPAAHLGDAILKSVRVGPERFTSYHTLATKLCFDVLACYECPTVTSYEWEADELEDICHRLTNFFSDYPLAKLQRISIRLRTERRDAMELPQLPPPPNQRGRKKDVSILKKTVELWNDGFGSIAEIARHLGVDRSTVSKRLTNAKMAGIYVKE